MANMTVQLSLEGVRENTIEAASETQAETVGAARYVTQLLGQVSNLRQFHFARVPVIDVFEGKLISVNSDDAGAVESTVFGVNGSDVSTNGRDSLRRVGHWEQSVQGLFNFREGGEGFIADDLGKDTVHTFNNVDDNFTVETRFQRTIIDDQRRSRLLRKRLLGFVHR